MEKRTLGDGLEVSAIGLGCMGFTHAYGKPSDDAEAMAAMRASFDAGCTFFDTAETYTAALPDGTTAYNEEIVGRALAAVRSEVQIATKFGVRHAGRELILDSKPETIRRAIDGSLLRLGTDHVDLYYQHRIDPAVEPEEVAEAVGGLIRAGKVLHWGISEADEEYLRRAHAVTPVACVQNRYSMMARWHEALWPALEELGIGFVAFSPLANGVLSGDFATSDGGTYGEGDYRAFMPQYREEAQEANGRLLALVGEIAEAHAATAAQVSLAWMLAKRPWIVPIPGSRRARRIRENIDAADVRLDAGEVSSIDALLDATEFAVFGGSPTRTEGR